MPQRFLNPDMLSGLSGLELIAKSVVNGFVAGLHRSPDFGFSQEFAEYRAYVLGDDLRHVDWNVYARTERAYLKRYRGETNTLLTVLLDASLSMQFGSHTTAKADYARYVSASLFYLALNVQHDAAGVIVFDDAVRHHVRPSTRQGQLHRLLAALELAEPRARTDFAQPMRHSLEMLRRRGLVIIISDFYEAAEELIKKIEPLKHRGNEVVLFHVLDPQELRPQFASPVVLVDLETQQKMQINPDYAKGAYRVKMDNHIMRLREGCRNAALDYFLLLTDRPLDAGLREYLAVRQRAG